MGVIHDRIKAKAAQARTIAIDVRIAGAAGATKHDTARRLSVFMANLDQARTVRYLDIGARHYTMQRLADEAKALGLKGRWNLVCNRTQCLRTPATFYNRGSYAFYCSDCAQELNRVNARDAERLGDGGPLCRNVGSAEEAANLHVMP